MPRFLLKDAANYFKENGNPWVTLGWLYAACRKGEIPHFRAGKRYVINTDEIEEFLKQKSAENVKPKESEFGKLRRVEVK